MDEILCGDQVVALASVTPAGGVVVAPVTNFALRDRNAGTVTVNSSVGAWKKLQRIRRDPHVALAFHTRTHGFSDRPEYVLVQGRATVSAPLPDYPRSLGGNWERFGDPPPTDPLWRWWLRVYYLRVRIDVAVERVTVWPDLACCGPAEVHGTALPSEPPPSQRRPANGTAPRVDHFRLARRASQLPNVLLGWVGADQLPVVAPVVIAGTGDDGIRLRADHQLLPAGRRRAGLAAHAFTPHVLGQHQRLATGWLEVEPAQGLACYAPHTAFGYRMPPSKVLYRSAVGLATRVGLRRARRAGNQ